MTERKCFVFRFADVEVKEREFLLIKAGERIAVEPKAFRVLLQAPLRGHGEDQRRAHTDVPNAESSSIEAAKPTAGIGSRAPSRDNSPS